MVLNETIDLTTAFTIAEGIDAITPLTLYVIGMAIYGVFIFKFYRFLGRKNVFELDFSKYEKSKHPIIQKIFGVVSYTIKYILLMPLFIFFWFLVLSLLLAFLSKNHDLRTVLLMAMAIVGAVRVTAYYNEDLSRDLAKMIPFALLGVFIVDITFFNAQSAIETVKSLPQAWKVLAYYLMFIISLEFILRIIHTVVYPFLPKSDEK